jgi:uncharacterized membrane protein SpoIIM required for sporulation
MEEEKNSQKSNRALKVIIIIGSLVVIAVIGYFSVNAYAENLDNKRIDQLRENCRRDPVNSNPTVYYKEENPEFHYSHQELYDSCIHAIEILEMRKID